MTITSTNPDSGTAVAPGSTITIVNTAPYLTQIVLRRDGWDDEVVYSGSSFEPGFTGTRVLVGAPETIVFRKDDGWTESPFQIVASASGSETTLNFVVQGASDYPAFMGVGGPWSRKIYLNTLLDVNAPDPNDTEVLAWDEATGMWVPRAASTPGAHVLDSHSDVTIAGPTNGQVLTYSNGSWINADATGGGGSGTVTSVAATGSGGITVSGSPIVDSGTLAFGINAGTLRATLGPSGTPSSTTYLRGDGAWATPATGGGGSLSDAILYTSPDNDVTIAAANPIIFRDGGATLIPLTIDANNTSSTTPAIRIERNPAYPGVQVYTATYHSDLQSEGLYFGGSSTTALQYHIEPKNSSSTGIGASLVIQGGYHEGNVAGGNVTIQGGGSATSTDGIVNIGLSTTSQINVGSYSPGTVLNFVDDLGNPGSAGQVLARQVGGQVRWVDQIGAGSIGTLQQVLTTGTPDNAVTLDGTYPIALTAGSSTPIFGIVSLNAGDTAITLGAASAPGEILQIGTRYVLFPAVDAGGNINHVIGGATSASANKLRATEIKGSSNLSSGGGGDIYLRQGTSSSGAHGEIHIGWSTGPSKLQITDSSGSTGTIGQVLTADGAGDATWAAGGGGSIGTLDQVINAGTPDNNVVVPAANPIVFSDGGVLSVTPLTITRIGSGTSPALIVNQTASTYPILQGTSTSGTVTLTGAGLVWDSGASTVTLGGGTNGGVGGGNLIVTAQRQSTSGTGGDLFLDGGAGVTGATDGDVYLGGFTSANVRIGKSGTVLHVIDDTGSAGTDGQVLAKTAGGQIRWAAQSGSPLTADELAAIQGAAAPSALNVFATMADVTGAGGGNLSATTGAETPAVGEYARFVNGTLVEGATVAEVLSDIGAAPVAHTHTLSDITDAGSAAGATIGTGDGQVPVYDGANNLTTGTLTATVGAESTEYGEYGIAPYASRVTNFTIGGTPQTGTVVDLAILGMASGANGLKGGKTEIWGGQAQVGVADGGNVSVAGGPGIGGGLAGKVEIGGSDGAPFSSEIHLLKGFSITETADRPVAPGAGKGQVWVRGSDNALVYTTPSDHPVAAYQGVNRHITPFIQAADPVATAVDGDVWIETSA